MLTTVQAAENPKIDPNYEKNATYPGLGHPVTLKLQPIRVSTLCLRSAYLHRGNALAALGRDEEARQTYELVVPMLDKEPRCGRLDWERSSILVNIGNTYSRQNNFEKACEYYDASEKLGREHVEAQNGNKTEGMGIMIVGMRARAFALKKAGSEEEGKAQLREVLKLQMELNAEVEKQKAEQKSKEEAAAAESAKAVAVS